MRKNWRRILSLLICAAMVMTMNTQAFAESLAGSASAGTAADESRAASGVTGAAAEETVSEDVSTDAAGADDSDIEAAGNKGDTTWQDSFTYTLDGTDIICSKYTGTATEVEIPAKATVSGTDYTTELEPDSSDIYNIIGIFQNTKVTSVSIDSGYMLGEYGFNNIFSGCSALKSVTLGSFNVKSGDTLNFSNMFFDCYLLSSITFGDSFKTSNVINMFNMFGRCNNLKSLDLSSFDTSNITYPMDIDIQANYMLKYCSKLTTLVTPKQSSSTFTAVLPCTMYDSENNSYSELPKGATKSIELRSDRRCVVSFNDVSGNTIRTESVIPGNTVSAPASEEAGYYYEWYTDQGLTNKYDLLSPVKSNLMLYEKKVAVSYSISFNANGGEGRMDGQEMKYAVKAAISDNQFKRKGYTFINWNTASDGTGTSYENGEEVKDLSSTNGATVTLYAQWTLFRDSISFNANGGSGTMAEQDMTSLSSASLSANQFTMTGYTFVSWNTAQDGSGTYYADKQMVDNLPEKCGAAVTLYAQWKANSYSISFNGNSGSGTMADQDMTYDAAAALSANQFKKTGYGFTNWNTAADGSGTSYAAGAEVKNLVSEDGVTVTMYAQWQVSTYRICFNANGGTGTKYYQEMTYDESYTLYPNPFVRTDCTFTGWNTAADGSGTSYADTATVKNIITENGATVTLYAQWESEVGWLNDYLYTVDETAQTITCTEYKNTTSTNAVVPASTVVNGKEYKTALSGNVFCDRSALKSISIEEGVKTGTSCVSMFYGCRGLTSLDIKGLDTSAAEDMSNMFCNCACITSLDLSSFNTATVYSMGSMFSGCSSLKELDLQSFNTSNVRSMSCMFFGCSSIKKLDLSSFDTSKVREMNYMFYGLSFSGNITDAMDSLDLSNFNISKVESMIYMFNDAYIKLLDISSFDMSNVQEADKMLYTKSGGGEIGVIRTPQKMGSISVDLGGIVFCDKWGNGYTGIPAGLTKSIAIAQKLNGPQYGYTYTVSIYDSSRNLIATEIIPRSDTVYIPDKYTALYTDIRCRKAYDTDTQVHSSMTLYVKGKDYKEPVIPVTFYTVTFNSDGGSAVSSVRVAAGDDITLPEDPSKPDSVFGGWFTRANGKGTQYTDGTAVTGDTTLYAYWFTSDWRTDISESIITAIKAQTYDGSEKRPALTVLDGSKKLTEGVDYEVSFTNNIDAGAATATVNGIGDYKGTKSMIFAINKKPFNSRDFVVNTTDMKLTVSGAKSPVTVYDRTLNDYLMDGLDYNVTYEDADKAGTAKVTVTAAYEGSYTGKLSRTYRIFDTADSVIAAVSIYTVSADYNGKAQKPQVISVKDADGTAVDETHYSVKYKNNKNAGLASVIVTGRRGYKGSVTVYFTINPISVAGLTGLSVNRISDRTFSGSPIKPKPTVKYTNEKGKTVTLSSKYYTVIYSDNVEAGTAHILVTGRGNYGGTASGTFEITQRALTKGVKVKGFKSAVKLGSGAATQSNLTLVCGKYELTEGTDYTVRYENNTAAGKAKAIIEAADDSSFKGSITKSFRVK